MSDDFIIGDMARISVTIKSAEGSFVDQTQIDLIIKLPDGNILSGVVPEKTGTGKYYYNMALTLAGYVRYRWVATGNNQGVTEGGFSVRQQSF